MKYFQGCNSVVFSSFTALCKPSALSSSKTFLTFRSSLSDPSRFSRLSKLWLHLIWILHINGICYLFVSTFTSCDVFQVCPPCVKYEYFIPFMANMPHCIYVSGVSIHSLANVWVVYTFGLLRIVHEYLCRNICFESLYWMSICVEAFESLFSIRLSTHCLKKTKALQ